jgi:hypothetical protein
MKLGLKPLVVGRDGFAYEKENWFESATFRNDDQMNLLVADNQTELYRNAPADMKMKLAKLAWGERTTHRLVQV